MTHSFPVQFLSMSWMMELVGWESVPFCSGLKGLCCHGSSLYEKAQSSILSTWIELLLLLPYKTLKLWILIRDSCAWKKRTSLPFLKIFCLEGQTLCCPWPWMEHRSVSSLNMFFYWTQDLIWMFIMYSHCRICEQQWKRKYLLKTKG